MLSSLNVISCLIKYFCKISTHKSTTSINLLPYEIADLESVGVYRQVKSCIHFKINFRIVIPIKLPPSQEQG